MSDLGDEMRGETALLIGVGKKLDDEWDRSDVPTVLRRLMDPMVAYTRGSGLSVVHYGSWAQVQRTSFSEFFNPANLSGRPDCGPGANLSGALHGALSQRQGEGQLNVFAVGDFDIDPDEVARVKRIIAFARNVTLMAVRIGADGDGLHQAHELDAFQSGPTDNVETVYCHDGRGRDIGHDIGAQVARRMATLFARRQGVQASA